MSKVLRIGQSGKVTPTHQESAALSLGDIDVRIALIQALIPLGLQAVEEILQQEVTTLAGPRYAREDGAPQIVRWGRQRGSIYLSDQKLPVQVPRVRDRQTATEVPLRGSSSRRPPTKACCAESSTG